MATFQRTLLSFDAPADHGDMPAAGASIFAAKCASCHAGRDYTDDRFHRLLPVGKADLGAGEITGQATDDGTFRTPSLRNVAVTGPWLHDGSAETLAAALAAHPGSDATDRPPLIAFLEALTDRRFLTDKRFGFRQIYRNDLGRYGIADLPGVFRPDRAEQTAYTHERVQIALFRKFGQEGLSSTG